MLRSPAFAAALLAAAPVAAQQDEGGLYLAVFGGLSLQEEQDADQTLEDRQNVVTLDFDPGFIAGGAVGYALPDFGYGRFRGEIEGAFRRNDVEGGSFNLGDQRFSGHQSSATAIFNVVYDITRFAQVVSPLVQPFVGAGVGIASIDSDVVYAPAGVSEPQVRFGGEASTELVWQIVAGVTFPVSRRFDLVIDGRYLAATDPDFDRVRIDTGERLGEFDGNYETWHVTAGFRLKF